MRYVCAISFLLPVFAFAAGLGANITVVDYFTTTNTLLGLYCDSYHIWGTDYVDDEVEGYLFDGTPYINIPLDYNASPFPWGVVVVPSAGNYYCDFASNYIYYDSGNWKTFVNPAGIRGRGLDYDGQYLWEADNDYGGNGNGIYRFNTDGTGAVFYDAPEPQHYLTGLTRFSFDGTEYVMVTTNEDHNFYYYRTDGTFAGSSPVPMTITYGYGVEYSSTQDSFFFSCVSYGNNCVYELDFDFYIGIKSSSLGEIKAAFR